jgi:hypothetical protein
VGGTERRPMPTARNRRNDLHLSLAVVVRTGLSCAKRVARLDDVGGNTSRDALFPSVFPLIQ